MEIKILNQLGETLNRGEKTMIIIEHERYGWTTEFETIEEAQAGFRACGPEWEDTTFRLRMDGSVVDDRGETVGYETVEGEGEYEEKDKTMTTKEGDKKMTIDYGTIEHKGEIITMDKRWAL
ncbi:MAG: hypothetical protein NUV65_06930 [Candidatus Roizmanbacteria bacterium]|nr:hypothetical protein [Candidatus Roizmanbacteria bacterium]